MILYYLIGFIVSYSIYLVIRHIVLLHKKINKLQFVIDANSQKYRNGVNDIVSTLENNICSLNRLIKEYKK